MTSWRRLSQRRGLSPQDEIYEGVPEHLSGPLKSWVGDQFMYKGNIMIDPIRHIALLCRIPVDAKAGDRYIFRENFIHRMSLDDDLFLDVIDALLANYRVGKFSLRDILDAGASSWTVTESHDGLQRRIDPTVQLAADEAMRTDDEASAELREAWASAYGRDQDASDAWDHAIKAVECVLVPRLVPNQDKPQFGHALGALRRDGDWIVRLKGSHDEVDSTNVLVSMLNLLWPNPDRHPSNARTPGIDEARDVLHLALTIVQWTRSGAITSTKDQ